MEIGEISKFHFVEKVHQFLSSGDRSIDSIDEQNFFKKKKGGEKGDLPFGTLILETGRDDSSMQTILRSDVSS